MLGTIVVFAAGAAACVPAMSASPAPVSCRVVQGEKLPAEVGGPAAVCASIERAIATRAPQVRYSAEVRILSQSSLAVNLTVDGHKLAEQHYSIMDRNLNPGTIKRFAEAIGEEVAKAARKS
jgi:hypothetical protein